MYHYETKCRVVAAGLNTLKLLLDIIYMCGAGRLQRCKNPSSSPLFAFDEMVQFEQLARRYVRLLVTKEWTVHFTSSLIYIRSSMFTR